MDNILRYTAATSTVVQMHSTLGSLPKRLRPHREVGQARSCNASGNTPQGHYSIGHYIRH